MKLLILCNDRLALPALNQLLQAKKVIGVGMTSKESEIQAVVTMMCSQYQVPLKRFRKNNFPEALRDWLTEEKPDAVLVKTFPWKIPEAVLDLPRYGFINFHYAPLPEYRGANPLFWMIRNGVGATGVTVHQMTAGIDEGPVLLQSKIPVYPGATFGMVVSGLGFSGLELTAKLLPALEEGTLNAMPQDSALSKWYGRPMPQDLMIDWKTMDAEAVRRLVNACNPWNKGAPARLNGWMVGLTYVTVVVAAEQDKTAAGTIISIDDAHGLRIACKDNTVIRADVVFTEEGYIPGFALGGFGIQSGMTFS